MATPVVSSHRWRFIRVGGFDQVKLETGADLMNLDQLDQKLWVALACPIAGLQFDPITAALIDTDHDGRIRPPELIAAVKWAGFLLKNPDDLIKGGDSLPLAAISDATSDGSDLLEAARHIAHSAGGKSVISLAETIEAGQTFAGAAFNGDGVIVPESATDDPTKAAVVEIISCVGSANDISGKPGVDQARADLFLAECAAFDGWIQTADADAAIRPLGEATAAAATAVQSVRAKADDFFARCRLAAFDPRAAAFLNRKEEDYAVFAGHDLGIDASDAAGFPLALITPGASLPLQGHVNPAHAAALAALRADAVKPLLGDKTELTEADWQSLQSRLGPFNAWLAAKVGASVEKLGVARVRELLTGPARDNINALIARDKSLEHQAAAIASVEKLIRFIRDLRLLCENFVNFKNLYNGDASALFQAGVLYLDQRSCRLCLAVEDAAKHSVMAGLAGAYLAYADCTRQSGVEKMSIVAVISQGDDENLMVGRNGIFYDRQGRDYDATITKILPNPISLRQAFWLPYKKAVRFIEEQVSKRAATASATTDTQLSTLAATATAPPAPAPPPPRKMGVDLSIVALISVACGSLAGVLVNGLGVLSTLAAWKLPLIVLGVLALISGPSLLLAYIKLRKRNLGPILDANGWAINTRAKINVPFGARLTGIAKLPPGATLDLHDRYAQKAPSWPKLLLVFFLIWWLYAILKSHGILY
jgi:hypothetical protein